MRHEPVLLVGVVIKGLIKGKGTSMELVLKFVVKVDAQPLKYGESNIVISKHSVIKLITALAALIWSNVEELSSLQAMFRYVLVKGKMREQTMDGQAVDFDCHLGH